MTNVYASAHNAILWLGEAEDDSDLAIDFMNSLRSVLLEEDKEPGSFSHTIRRNVSAESVELSKQEKTAWVAIYKLLRRPYFTRAWCVQEQVVASNNKCFVCGDKTVVFWIADLHSYIIAQDWNFFRQLHDEATDQITNFFPYFPDTWFLKTAMVKDMQMALDEGKIPTLLSLLIANKETQAGHPHDKIYAFWGLSRDAKALLRAPNYDLPVQDLYTTLVTEWIHYYKSLDIICASQRRASGSGGVHGLAMWVPDWSAIWIANTFISRHPLSSDFLLDDLECKPLYRASGTIKPRTATGDLPNGGENDPNRQKFLKALVVAGLSYDEIKEIGPVCSVLPGRPLEEWKAMLQLDRAETTIARNMIIKKFWRTMMAGLDPVGESLEGKENVISDCLGSERFPDDPDMQRFLAAWPRGVNLWLQRCSNIIRNRRFVITEKGYFGLVHRYVKVGDEVCILFGCSVPVILRKWNWEQHLFLGDCYIDGWMDGEIVESVGGEEVIEDKITEGNFVKWLDDPSAMPKQEGEPKALFLV